MSDAAPSVPARRGFRDRVLAFVARPDFQNWAARFPLTRPMVRREGEALFDLVAGFVNSQMLAALLGTGVIGRLQHGPEGSRQLALALGADPGRIDVLCTGGVALGLLRKRRDGRFELSVKGAVLPQVPGLQAMIAHHDILYRDLADPVAFFTEERQTELARFWPYVFGAGAAEDPAKAQRFSRLMAQSLSLVAEDTLATRPFEGTRHLMDVGGGQGAFLRHVADARPDLRLSLFDLPSVVSGARDLPASASIHAGSFRDDPLPEGADAISLIRVLYDHEDATVQALLERARAALPTGGRVVISEPMLTGHRATDVYFATYVLAMGTGRTRSPGQIMALLRQAGFTAARQLRTRRRFVTSVVTARKP